MSPTERRQKLLEALCLRRYDTYSNLACEFGVSKRTICNDIGNLMCTYPIETMRGRYGGGVKVMDGYYFNFKSSTHRALTKEQTAVLKKCRRFLCDSDRDTINSILVQFAP